MSNQFVKCGVNVEFSLDSMLGVKFYFIPGNKLIIRSIIGFPEMKSATNYFLASLAVADLCITSVLPAKAVSFILYK